jgi:hypothetical protein
MKIREVTVEPSDGRLGGLRVQFTEHWPLAFPPGEFVLLVVLARLVVWAVLVVPSDVVVELAMNIEMVYQSLRYRLCRVGAIAVTVLHRCLLINDVFS